MATEQNYILKLAKEEQSSLFHSRMDQAHKGLLKFLRSPAMYVVLLLISVGLAFGISLFGIVFGIVFIGVGLSVPAGFHPFSRPQFLPVFLLLVAFLLWPEPCFPVNSKLRYVVGFFFALFFCVSL